MEIEGFENYLIYENGQVWTKNKNRFMKPSMKNNYLAVVLWKDGKQKTITIHRLIALYYIPNPYNKKCVDHIDRVTTNNNINNLRWATCRENCSNKSNQNKYIGVHKHGNKYLAKIHVNCKNIYIGSYKTEEEAREAYINYRDNLIFKENAITINININMPVKKTVAVEEPVAVEETVPEIMVVIKTDEDEKHLAKLKKQKEYREKNKDVINEKRRAKRQEAKLVKQQ